MTLARINQLADQCTSKPFDAYKEHTMAKQAHASLKQEISTLIRDFFQGKSSVTEDEFIQVVENKLPLLNNVKYSIDAGHALRANIHRVVAFKFFTVYNHTLQKYGSAMESPDIKDVRNAFSSGDKDFCRWMIKEFNIDINVPYVPHYKHFSPENLMPSTFICTALTHVDNIALETLLSLGADTSLPNCHGTTPLYLASSQLSYFTMKADRLPHGVHHDVGELQRAVDLLEKHGAQKDIMWELEFLRSTIHVAGESESSKLTEAELLSKIQGHIAALGDSIDRNAILIAFANNFYAFVEKKYDRIVNYILDNWDLTEVMTQQNKYHSDLKRSFLKADENQNYQLCAKLVEKLHLDLNVIERKPVICDWYGRPTMTSDFSSHTYIIDAVLESKHDLLGNLLNLGANPNLGVVVKQTMDVSVKVAFDISLTHEVRKSALDIAREKGDERLIALLVQHGALTHAQLAPGCQIL